MHIFVQRLLPSTANGLKYSSILRPSASRSLSGFSFAGPKSLDQILDKDAVGKLNGDEVRIGVERKQA